MLALHQSEATDNPYVTDGSGVRLSVLLGLFPARLPVFFELVSGGLLKHENLRSGLSGLLVAPRVIITGAQAGAPHYSSAYFRLADCIWCISVPFCRCFFWRGRGDRRLLGTSDDAEDA